MWLKSAAFLLLRNVEKVAFLKNGQKVKFRVFLRQKRAIHMTLLHLGLIFGSPKFWGPLRGAPKNGKVVPKRRSRKSVDRQNRPGPKLDAPGGPRGSSWASQGIPWDFISLRYHWQ